MKIISNHITRSLVLGLVLTSHCIVYGQKTLDDLDKIIPPSPTAASLGKFGNIPVSLYTGTPEITIPLYRIQGRVLSLPLFLAYHASGLKVEEIPGWVGAGWSLNAGGVITRSVVDQPDDGPSGYFLTTAHNLPPPNGDLNHFGRWSLEKESQNRQEYVQIVSLPNMDTEPDLFFFNFNGRVGKFVFDASGNIHTIPHQNLVILPLKDVNYRITGWRLIDEDGTVYEFGQPAASEITLPLNASGNPESSFISSWYITTMRSANGEDEIQFSYEDYTATYRYPLPYDKTGCEFPQWDDLTRYIQTMIQGKYLHSIEFAGGTATFNTLNLGQFPGGSYTVLSSFRILNSLSQIIKFYQFQYSFFPSIGCESFEDYLPPCRRVRLDKITELDRFGQKTNLAYWFFYDDTPLPPRGSFSQDFWGYYNGAVNEHLIPSAWVRNYWNYEDIPPGNRRNSMVNFDDLTTINLNIKSFEQNQWKIPGADRQPDAEFAKAGILTKIVYPTGGFTRFEYESNDFGFYMSTDKPKKNSVDAIRYMIDESPVVVNKTVWIKFPQRVRVFPLFFVQEGSGKTLPSPTSQVVITDLQEPDSLKRIKLSYTYSQAVAEAGGIENEKELWLEQGFYRITAVAPAKGDYTRLIMYASENSAYDSCYQVYSNIYKDTLIRAGHLIWPDDTGSFVTARLALGNNDRKLVTIQYQLYSTDHNPNIISSGLYSPPVSYVRLKDKDEKIFFTRFFADDYPDSVTYLPLLHKWLISGSYSMTLPSGDYTLEFNPRISTECGMISVDYEKFVRHNYRTLAGGVRIKTIIDGDNEHDTLGWKKFQYTMNDDTMNGSSGVLLSYPLHDEKPEDYYYGVKEGDYFTFGCFPIKLVSTSKNVLGSTQGSHIGYRRVRITYPDGGYVIHQFTSPFEFPDISDNRYPYAPIASFDWKRGLPMEISYYNNSGILRKKESYRYNFFDQDSVNRLFIPALRVVKPSADASDASLRKYIIPTGWGYHSLLSTVQFDINGKNPFTLTEEYRYDPEHLQLKSKKSTNSNGEKNEDIFLYPTDFPTGYSAANEMLLQRHMISKEIQKETFINDIRMNGERTIYELFYDDKLVLPSRMEILEGEIYKPKTYFDLYDNRANLLQYHDDKDIYHSVHWDSDQLYPILKVDHALYQPDTSLYDKKAMQTRYDYIPLVGLSSITDPNGRRTINYYDKLWRPDYSMDFEGNIMYRNSYGLMGYQGDTIRDQEESSLVYSLAPDGIQAGYTEVYPYCATTLTVVGGRLGSFATWTWYQDGCGGITLGNGASINVNPRVTTTYYVQAISKLNITPCKSITIQVLPSALSIIPRKLDFGWEGTLNNPRELAVANNSCEKIGMVNTVTWISVKEINPEKFVLTIEANPSAEHRSCSLVFLAGGATDTVFIQQFAEPFLQLTAEKTPVSAGELVNFNALLENALTPCRFLWEVKDISSSIWITIKDTGMVERINDSLKMTAGSEDFNIRCTATQGEYEYQQTLTIKILY